MSQRVNVRAASWIKRRAASTQHCRRGMEGGCMEAGGEGRARKRGRGQEEEERAWRDHTVSTVRLQSDLQEPGQSSPAVTWFVCEVDLHLPQCTSFVDRLSGALGHATLAGSALTSVPTGECETQWEHSEICSFFLKDVEGFVLVL